jgi:putative aldouronate transport system substrate-binding protein
MNLTRRSLLALLVLIAITISLVACGQTTTTKPSTTSETTAKPDPLGKYDPAITLSFVNKGVDGPKWNTENSPEDNYWTRAFAKDMGINLKLLWSTTSAESTAKWDLTMASGELPDIMQLNQKDFATLLKAGMLEDMTQAYDVYATPEYRSIYDLDNGRSLNFCKVDGKLMALTAWPANADIIGSFYWIRYDWMKKLNLPDPTTMQDILAIARAFTTQDPDGNGQNDTIGLPLNKDLFYINNIWLFPLADGFFNSYHSYPTIWQKNASNQLAYGGIQPEAKAPLLELQKLYAEGVIDKEYGTKDSNKVVEEITNGKIGLFNGLYYGASWPIDFNMEKDPKAEWRSFGILSIDNNKSGPGVYAPTVTSFTVLKKGTGHPEALVKMFNYYVKAKLYDNSDAMIKQDFKAASPVTIDPGNMPILMYDHISAAVTSNDTSKLNSDELGIFNEIAKYKAGERVYYGSFALFTVKPDGFDGAIEIMKRDYLQDKRQVYDAYWGPITPTGVSKGATLFTMMVEAYTRIIMGAPISEFDTFTDNWLKNGGSDLTKEVNEWAAANAK